MHVVLASISIILIIGIVILILYKNVDDNTNSNMPDIKNMLDIENMPDIKDKQYSPYNFNITENFTSQDELKLITNKIKINNSLQQLFAFNPSITTDDDPIVIDNNFQNNVASNINVFTNELVNKANSSVSTSSSLIGNLENLVTDLENHVNNTNKLNINKNTFTNIKSLNNGMEMELVQSPNTFYINPVTNTKTPAYLLKLNNGCLSVGAHDYDVYKCDDKNVKQYFKMEHILNDDQYVKNIDTAVAFDKVDPKNINYPFAMVKSINNDNCLTNNHGSITVQPCYSFAAQRWMPL